MASEQLVVSERMRFWRAALISLGAVLLALGGFVFITGVRPDDYPGVALWLVAAIALHDGVGAMAVFAFTVVLRCADRRIPFEVLAIVQASAAITVILTVIVVPEILQQASGPANSSILPLDYARNLLLVSAGIALATVIAVAVAVAARVRVRRRTR